ncbi:hypothetical protein ACIGXM_11210 [Kitasatospora sp. NPDC052896]|uniref:hypothetical protein n=1 Tax=Kitasatospora sp. NPDC052896 TaxID=3364061 RepID=UPI0037C547E0
MTASDTRSPRRTAGLFDLRWILALLFALYGTVLTVLGAAFTSPAELARADGGNINLWAGIAQLLVAAAFAGWALLRPIRLPVDTDPS